MARPEKVTPIDGPEFTIDPAQVESGRRLYPETCMGCHGAGAQSSGYAPDLRASPVVLDQASFKAVLHDGILESRGMPRYAEFTDADLLALRSYIRKRAREDLGMQAMSTNPDRTAGRQ